MISNVVIIGGGLLGTEIKEQIIKNNGKAIIIKNIKNDDKNLIPKNTDCVIIVAQSKDYKEKIMTKDLLFCNTILPLKILMEAYESGVKKIGFCSTGSVYNNSKKYHTEEEELSLFADSPYTSSKISAEILLEINKKLFERFVIYRPFFIYGKNQTDEKIIPRIINSIKNNNEITLAQNKGMIFNPIYVSDAAKFVINSLESNNGFEIFNLAGKDKVTLKNIVDIISKKLEINPKIKITENNASYVLGSTDKIRSTGFEHEIELEDGLYQMLS